jgi:hypothetical protein
MPIYKIYLRSFAPWRSFGTLLEERSIGVPKVDLRPPSPFRPPVTVYSVPVPFGGAFHGDGRRFSLETAAPSVTSRVNAVLEVDVDSAAAGQSKAWCDPSHGPRQGIGFHGTAVGIPTATFSVSKTGNGVKATIVYGAPNPLVTGAPDIDASGEYTLIPSAEGLQIDATITGDQFPACESFIEDPCGTKLFVGGFAPDNKEQILRLLGTLNKPKEVWFESHVSVKVDARGCFLELQGGGSGSNVTGPACETLTLTPLTWNKRIMTSIPMPADAP